MSVFNKRKRDAPGEDTKKPKALIGEKERELLSQSSEWPLYNHPDGGTVKITPWGSLRQWVDPATGENRTKFEDASFLDLLFEMSPNNSNNQCYELPSTPMSLNPTSSSRSSPGPGDRFAFSPSSDAEQYVVDGYRGREHIGQQQFAQEQENYLGMDDHEEYSDNNDSMMMETV